MLADFTRPILNMQGEPYRENGEPVIAGTVTANIISVLPADATIPANERKKRFHLSLRIYKAEGPVEIDEADADLIEKLINASALPPLFSEQVCLALRGKPNPLAQTGECGAD